MPGYDLDLFVIGAGSGGIACARRAASYGARVAVAEEGRIGGTCVNRGCVPKKLLVYAAQFRDAFEDAAGFGWRPALPAFEWADLVANKDREIDRLNGIYRDMLAKAGVEYLAARATLVDGHTVGLGNERRTARHVLIATGGRPWRPDGPGVAATLVSDDALALDEFPRRLLVVGGGYIAVEFAGIFAGLGAEVALVVRGEAPLTGFDHDIRAALAEEMAKRGIAIHVRTSTRRVNLDGRSFAVETADGRSLAADQVLFATGRVPNTRGLGLEEAGVSLAGNGAVAVDDGWRTSLPSVFAIGDCTDRRNLTPVAIAEGRALAETLFNANPTRVDYDLVPTAVFSQPPIATVGLTEARARERLGEVDVYMSRFRPMKHALSGRDERTLMKLVVERAGGRVVGCHMLGADAPEIVQGLAVALTAGATKRDFDATVGIHPTAAEEFVLMREPVRPAAGAPEAEAAR
ncbi:MAG: glutathione-disulfide reductase [Proteobacteria bacterium]|nr:glutathione-disulfide reductase [Pseudomonadota bacterium]